MDYDQIITEIEKKYKHHDMLLNIYFENYHSNYFYLRIDYLKTNKCYRLSCINLADYQDNVERIASSIYLDLKTIEKIKGLLGVLEEPKEKVIDKNKVTICYKQDKLIKTIHINRFLSKRETNLYGLFLIIFDNIPKKYSPLYLELASEFFGTRKQYEFDDTINFDLYNDELERLFKKDTIQKGTTYFKENRVFFLEQIGSRFFSVVGGVNKLHVVIIDFDAKLKRARFYCNCKTYEYCHHLYATILAIRAKKIHKFFKIVAKNSSESLLDKVFNINFLLTIGIDDQNRHYLVIDDGEIRLMPVLDKDGKSLWNVLEDDKNNTLTNRLKEIIK